MIWKESPLLLLTSISQVKTRLPVDQSGTCSMKLFYESFILFISFIPSSHITHFNPFLPLSTHSILSPNATSCFQLSISIQDPANALTRILFVSPPSSQTPTTPRSWWWSWPRPISPGISMKRWDADSKRGSTFRFHATSAYNLCSKSISRMWVLDYRLCSMVMNDR